MEIHIEQGPVLEHEAIAIGAVHAIPAVRWQRVTIEGAANHAGTTPMTLRHDAGLAAARAIAFIADCAAASPPAVATVGSVRFEPDTVNVIPGKAMFTIDLRAPDEDLLSDIEHEIEVYLDGIANQHGLKIERQDLVRFPSVEFAPAIVDVIEKAASSRDLSVKRMVSGAGHDAQMIARMAPAAMIFVPSKGGISHSPAEYTPDSDLVAGANVLLDVVTALADS